MRPDYRRPEVWVVIAVVGALAWVVTRLGGRVRAGARQPYGCPFLLPPLPAINSVALAGFKAATVARLKQRPH